MSTPVSPWKPSQVGFDVGAAAFRETVSKIVAAGSEHDALVWLDMEPTRRPTEPSTPLRTPPRDRKENVLFAARAVLGVRTRSPAGPSHRSRKPPAGSGPSRPIAAKTTIAPCPMVPYVERGACPYCGTGLAPVDPPRIFRCSDCGREVYHNAVMGGGIVVVDGDAVLLVEDFRNPGAWTLPEGRPEIPESPRRGVARELAEESGLRPGPEGRTREPVLVPRPRMSAGGRRARDRPRRRLRRPGRAACGGVRSVEPPDYCGPVASRRPDFSPP